MIESVLASAIGLPSWMITAIVGVVLGGLGGLLGVLLQNVVGLAYLSRILAILGAVASLQVSNWIVIPAIVTAAMNIDLPKKLDEVTTLIRAEYDGRRYDYDYQLGDNVPETTTASTLKAGLLDALCAHWGPKFAQGNASGADYNYLLRNQTLSFSIEPADCP